MDTDLWLLHFQRNALRRDPSLPARIDVPPLWRTPLIDSLARFQLGEAGEGRIAGEARISRDPLLDDPLRECIALWVREEGRHALELARAVRALGGQTLRHHPTETLFRHGRRMLGLRTKLVVAAAAEIVGLVHYDLLAERAPSAPLRELAGLLVADERQHLEFLRDVMRRASALSPVLTVAAPALLVAALGSAVALLAVDHRRLHALLECSPAELARRCGAEVRATSRTDQKPGSRKTPLAAGPALIAAAADPGSP